jgi:hypothetical protein
MRRDANTTRNLDGSSPKRLMIDLIKELPLQQCRYLKTPSYVPQRFKPDCWVRHSDVAE